MRCNGEFGGSRRSSSLLANKDRKMFGCNVLNEGDAIYGVMLLWAKFQSDSNKCLLAKFVSCHYWIEVVTLTEVTRNSTASWQFTYELRSSA